jgi:hypothetical protein
MLEVEGKTFHKFIEKKNYRVELYKNFCDIDSKHNNSYASVHFTKNKEKFYTDTQLFSEDDFVKHYGNPCASVFRIRYRFFIEESENKISLKYQLYTKQRRVGGKFFVERKTTEYFSFNFKTKLFYSGTFITKKKQKMGARMKVNPTYVAVQSFLRSVHVDESVKPENHFIFFLEKIWDKLGIENPQDFKWDSPESFYSLTYYLVNGIKIPNNWRKFTYFFIPKKDLKSSNMNLVDSIMKKLNLKGSKVKQIFNEMEWIDFDRLYLTYNLLGIDRFNKIENKVFDPYYSDVEIPIDMNKMGGSFECFYLDKEQSNQYFLGRTLVPLTPKEKDRILDLMPYFDHYKWRTLIDHLDMKRDLMNLGEDVKFKFTNISSFNLEHEEFSRLLQSYRKGEVERFYGDVDSLETPIEHEGETYYPVLLRKTADYEKESQHQRNCVRGYSERPDCLIFSIRKDSTDGDDRITVEYRYKIDEILNVQERARFNETPSLEFSQVAKIQLANINLLYKLGTLKLPRMVKKYRNGKTVEQESTFKSLGHEGTRVIAMTPHWNYPTPELQNWQNDILYHQDYQHLDFVEDLLP